MAGEAKPASPQKAVEQLNSLPNDEKAKVLDYLKSALTISNEPAN